MVLTLRVLLEAGFVRRRVLVVDLVRRYLRCRRQVVHLGKCWEDCTGEMSFDPDPFVGTAAAAAAAAAAVATAFGIGSRR